MLQRYVCSKITLYFLAETLAIQKGAGIEYEMTLLVSWVHSDVALNRMELGLRLSQQTLSPFQEALRRRRSANSGSTATAWQVTTVGTPMEQKSCKLVRTASCG